jgi:hypothetical protein
MTQHPIPFWTIPVATYLFFEMAIRFHTAWSQHRPCGSAIGMVVCLLYWLVAGGRTEASPFANPRGHGTPILSSASDERQHADALLLREPLATLLPASDQGRLRERFGYDYRRLSGKVAGFLLAVAILGVVSSLLMRAIVSGIIALALAVEQLVRLAALARAPQPSILGWLARPLLRKLL